MKVSVVIPAYNASEFISEAIESIINQDYKNYEIIVVDDGSTDGTREVLAPLVGANTIKYFFKPNGGPSSARNFGIEKAQGEFIGFLDADDVFLPGMMVACLSELQNKKYDLVSVDNYMVYLENEKEIQRKHQRYDWIEVPSSILFCTFLVVGGIGGLHKAFFKKSVFEQVGLLDVSLPVYEDLDLWIRIARQNLKWGHIRKPLVQYSHRGGGTSLFTHDQKRNQDCRLRILRRYKAEAIKRCPGIKEEFGEQLWNFGRSYLLCYRSYLKGLNCLLESYLTSPKLGRVLGSTYNQLLLFHQKLMNK